MTRRTSDQFNDTQLNDHSINDIYTRPVKRARQSTSEPANIQLTQRRRVFLDTLREHLPFIVQYRDQAPASIRKSVATSHSIHQTSQHGIRVWITGLNVDNEVFTLKKTTGLIVLVEYRPPTNTSSSSSSNTSSCYYQADALSSSALCTFLSHVHTGEINQTQLLNFFRSNNSNRTLLSITARFPLINGFTRLIYVNTYNQLALLADLFTRGVRTRNNDDIPKLTKMLKPKKDTNIPNHAVLPQTEKIVASPYASRQNVASIKSSSSNTSVLSSARRDDQQIEFDSLSDDDSASDDSFIPHSSNPDQSRQSIATNHVPFHEYDFVLTWWCDPRSPSYSRASNLFASFSSAHPKVGVCELTCEDVDVELVLTRMGIRILSALSAPTIRAISQSDRQRELMDHLQSKLQAGGDKLSAPLPLRLEDACLVIADRQFFVRTVYPFIFRPNTMYELTFASPSLEYSATSTPFIKSEQDNGLLMHPSVQSTVQTDSKARSASIELVSSHVRRTCSPSSFLLYSMQPSTPSLFFPPVHCKSVYSMAIGHLIERPCVIEWPSHLPFNASLLVQWCQFHVQFGKVSHIMVVIPCRCWQSSTVTEMRATISREALAGQQHRHSRTSNVAADVPNVVLKSVFCTARPAPLIASRQNKLQILDDSHFFVAHFNIQSTLQPDNQTTMPSSSRSQTLQKAPSHAAPLSLNLPPDSPPHLSPATPRPDPSMPNRASQGRSNVARPLPASSSHRPVSRNNTSNERHLDNQHPNNQHPNPFAANSSSQRSSRGGRSGRRYR